MNKELKDEIKETAPLLAKVEDPELSVPDGYFDNFGSKLLKRIKEEKIRSDEKQDAKVVQFLPAKKYLATAVIFIFMGLSMLLYKINHQIENTKNDNLDTYVQELDENSIIEYAIVNTNEQTEETDHYHPYLDEESIIEEINM